MIFEMAMVTHRSGCVLSRADPRCHDPSPDIDLGFFTALESGGVPGKGVHKM